MTALEFSPIKIFLSYSQNNEDVLLKDGLTKHLLFLKNKGLITIWGYSEVNAGEEKEQVSNKNLREADIVLLLISPDFFNASDYCITQMNEALNRHKKENTCVIPILLRPVYWQDEPFNNLEILPKNTEPINSWSNTDEAFRNIAQNMRETVYNLLKSRCMKIGKKLYEDNHLENSLTSFEQAIQFDAQFDEAYLWKGKVLSQLGQHTKALVAYDQAIHLNPKNANYFSEKGSSLLKLKRYTDALECLNQAIQLNPENADFYLEKSNIYEQLSQYAEALTILDQAVQFNPKNANIYFLKATYYYKLIQYEDALLNCKIAIGLEPNKASYHALIADLYEKLDQNKKALEAIKKAIILDPKKAEYYANAGKYHWFLDQYEEALLALEVAIKLDSQNAGYYVLKANHLRYISERDAIYKKFFSYNVRDNSNCEMIYKQIVQNSAQPWPTNTLGYSFYIFNLSSSDILKSALESINKALGLDSENFEYHLLKAETLFLLNRSDEAISVYDQLLKPGLSQDQRKRVYQNKIAIYNIFLERIRDEAKDYGIRLR